MQAQKWDAKWDDAVMVLHQSEMQSSMEWNADWNMTAIAIVVALAVVALVLNIFVSIARTKIKKDVVEEAHAEVEDATPIVHNVVAAIVDQIEDPVSALHLNVEKRLLEKRLEHIEAEIEQAGESYDPSNRPGCAPSRILSDHDLQKIEDRAVEQNSSPQH